MKEKNRRWSRDHARMARGTPISRECVICGSAMLLSETGKYRVTCSSECRKEKRRIDHDAWNARNPGLAQKRAKEWNTSNPEKAAKARLATYDRHRLKYRAKARERNLAISMAYAAIEKLGLVNIEELENML